MSGNRFAANEQYARRQAETAKATVMSFYDMAQKGVQATLDWQKFMFDVAVCESTNVVEVQKAILDAVVRQSSAFVGAAQQQFEDSMTVFANLTHRWFEDVRTIQNTFAGVVRRATQETPIPRPSKEAETEALEVSGGDRDELAHGIQQTSKSLAVLSESIQQSAERTVEAQKTIPGFQDKAVTEAVQKSGMAGRPVTGKEVLDETAKPPTVDRRTPAVPSAVAADVDQESTPLVPSAVAADVDQESTPAVPSAVAADVDQGATPAVPSAVAADVDPEPTPAIAAEAPRGGSGSGAADSLARSAAGRTRAVRKPQHPPAAGKHP
jgi:hypothetical protein